VRAEEAGAAGDEDAFAQGIVHCSQAVLVSSIQNHRANAAPNKAPSA
jgi:hypothetical protein